MKFGPVSVSEAEGAILAHSLGLPDGRLRKGRVLTPDDLKRIKDAGLTEVTVARLGAEDLHEDAAAERLASAIVPDPERAGLRLGQASTGRVNIYATAPGVIEVLADRIDALNALHPMITVATVPAWQRAAINGMVATVKIISYGVPKAALEAACLAGQSALRLKPAQHKTARLIQTTIDPEAKGEKGQAVTKERLDRLEVRLAPECQVRHDVSALAEALRATQEELVLILTGSATSDPYDVAPEALRQAGGEVIHFGMPVDPGNLLFFGSLDDRPVIGLPGCARSPAMNGADWVLERLICGVKVAPGDIARMGVGGLLKEIPMRGRLREA
jgi:molybdenum cofactor cytidylyltransferase